MTSEAPTARDVTMAAVTIAGHVVRTPTTRSLTLSELTGAAVWVKFEQFQFTASFKERGARNVLEHLDDEARRHGVIAVSAGNHAQGVAHHAQRMGIPATIVMPAATPGTKVARTRVLGATVVLHGRDFEEAAAHAATIAAATGATSVHPFDDPHVIAGQGTVALEMLADVPELEVLVVPVGGGGLVAGMALAVRDRAPHVRVVGVQAEGTDWAARRKGHAPTTGPGAPVAEGIAVKGPGRLTAPLVDALVDDVVTVSDDGIEQAVGMYLDIEKVVAEGAGAASLAALLEHPAAFAGRRCGLVLSGGNIDLRLLAGIAVRTLARDGRLTRLTAELEDRPGTLAELVTVIARAGGNVVDIVHRREGTGRSAKYAAVDVDVETPDAATAARVVADLRTAGIEVGLPHPPGSSPPSRPAR